jgi:N-acylneuraminate cytidylyltransferase/CMP-N,N'-diacetyllegionaminic acid synthase
MKKTLAIIPARGGSKQIKNKNVKSVAGKPLLAWTILEAKASRFVDRIIVSTDSAIIAEVACKHKAEVPFLRPKDLAQDDTPGILPILHAIRWLEQAEGYKPDYVITLQPTSPLRSSEDIDASIHLMEQKDAEAVVSVVPVNHHPYWMKKIDVENRIEDFISSDAHFTCRQDLPLVYALNGAIYLTQRDILLQKETWYTEKTIAYIMPPERSLDVDTPWDMYIADLVLRDQQDL